MTTQKWAFWVHKLACKCWPSRGHSFFMILKYDMPHYMRKLLLETEKCEMGFWGRNLPKTDANTVNLTEICIFSKLQMTITIFLRRLDKKSFLENVARLLLSISYKKFQEKIFKIDWNMTIWTNLRKIAQKRIFSQLRGPFLCKFRSLRPKIFAYS